MDLAGVDKGPCRMGWLAMARGPRPRSMLRWGRLMVVKASMGRARGSVTRSLHHELSKQLGDAVKRHTHTSFLFTSLLRTNCSHGRRQMYNCMSYPKRTACAHSPNCIMADADFFATGRFAHRERRKWKATRHSSYWGSDRG